MGGPCPRTRQREGGRYPSYRPGWTVFHLPSTPASLGSRGPSDPPPTASMQPKLTPSKRPGLFPSPPSPSRRPAALPLQPPASSRTLRARAGVASLRRGSNLLWGKLDAPCSIFSMQTLLNTSQLVSTLPSMADRSDAATMASWSSTSCIGDVEKAFASVVREN